MNVDDLKKLKENTAKVCLGCGQHYDDCLVHKMLETIEESIAAGTHVIEHPEFKDLLEDIKKYDAKGLDLLEREVENLCMQCPDHKVNCAVNRCRKCLSMLLYGKISPFRDETAEDMLRIRGKGYSAALDIEKAPDESEAPETPVRAAEDSETVKLVNFIIKEAARLGASDIHIEPGEKETACRYRIDGMLKAQPGISVSRTPKVISRVKILAGIDIAQKRIPQDGRISVKFEGRQVDIRVSTFPSVFGEKAVMRLIDRNREIITLDRLGFSQENIDIFRESIRLTNGIILLTGPTGSGKSSTIFAALKEINRPDINIVTLEDPVEQTMPGLTQGQVNPRAGFTFASGLRSIMRQDPDVIAVGEIRDRETAEIAMQAALTGHLVFSTLHTNSAAASFMRLFDMKVAPFLVAATLRLLIAQRLVRVLCTNCRKEFEPDRDTIEHLGLRGISISGKFFRPAGCRECGGLGYRGRQGIFELLTVDAEIRELAAKERSSEEIERRAVEKGMKLMVEDGINKASRGITSLEEVLRVTSG